jgi:hypothetical protein
MWRLPAKEGCLRAAFRQDEDGMWLLAVVQGATLTRSEQRSDICRQAAKSCRAIFTCQSLPDEPNWSSWLLWGAHGSAEPLLQRRAQPHSVLPASEEPQAAIPATWNDVAQ